MKRNDIIFDISYSISNSCGAAHGCTYFSNSGGPEIVTRGDELLSVYPNPVQSQFTIVQITDHISVTAGADGFSAQLFDPQGRLSKLGESSNGKLILDTSDLPKGMYYLNALVGGEVIRKQIMKDK